MNYRGSTGFGQDSILSLPGNVGHQDVQDVQVAGLAGGEAAGGALPQLGRQRVEVCSAPPCSLQSSRCSERSTLTKTEWP